MTLKNRHSMRLKGYDYSNEGAYLITICTKGRLCLLGDIIDGNVQLNEAGKMVRKQWLNIPELFFGVELDTFVIMPNHVHGIIVIVGATLAVAQNSYPNQTRAGASPAPTVGDIIGAFKSITGNKYLDLIKRTNPQDCGKLWQRNYYDHVIRNENDLNKIREYINNNPIKWELDKYYLKEN